MALARPEHMARIKDRDTVPEVTIRRWLWNAGLRYRLRQRIDRVRPDLVFPGHRVAIFVDGCFWHGCPLHYSRPRTRTAFWASKLRDNVHRDRSQTASLEWTGWRVVRLWEHDVKGDPADVISYVKRAMSEMTWVPDPNWRVVWVEPVPAVGHDWERRLVCQFRSDQEYHAQIGPRVTGGHGKGRSK